MSHALQPAESSPAEYDVFISYRTTVLPDKLVAETLQEVIESFPVPRPLAHHAVAPRRWRTRLRVFRDTTDLSASADLTEAIRQKLRRSRYLVVVCTPDLPRSAHCAEEIRYFRECHGDDRVLLLLARGDPAEAFPGAATAGDPTVGARRIGQPLAADIRAESTQSMLRLLRGKGLPKAAQPRFKLLSRVLNCRSPDDLVRRDRERLRRLAANYTLLFLLLAGTFGAVTHQVLRRQRIQESAVQIMAGLGGEGLPTTNEYRNLERLANSSPAVRVAFTEHLLRSPDKAERLLSRMEHVAHALTGLDLEERDRFQRLLRKLAPPPTIQAPAVPVAWALLGWELRPEDAEFARMVTSRLVTVAGGSIEESPVQELVGELPAAERATLGREILAAVPRAGDSDRRSALGRELERLHQHLSIEQRADLLDEALRAMEHETNHDVVEDLAAILRDGCTGLPPEYVAALLGRVVEAMRHAANPDIVASMAVALDTLKDPLAADQVPTLAQEIAGLMSAIRTSEVLVSLGEALGRFGERLPPESAATAGDQLVAALDRVAESRERSALIRVLGILGPRLPAAQAATAARVLLSQIEATTDASDLASLAHALAPLSGQVPADQVPALAHGVTAAMERTTAPYALAPLGSALSGLGARLAPESATNGARHIVAAMVADAPGGQQDKPIWSSLRQTLEDLARWMPAADVLELARRVLAGLDNLTSWERVDYLAETLGKLGKVLPAETATTLGREVVSSLATTRDAGPIASRAAALAEWGEHLPPEALAAAAQVVLATLEKGGNSTESSSLATALGALGRHLPASEIDALAGQIVASTEQTADFWQRSSLVRALDALGERVPAEQAAAAAGLLVSAWEATSDSIQISHIGGFSGWTQLDEGLNPGQITALARQLLGVMHETADERKQANLGRLVERLGRRLPAQEAAALAREILTSAAATTNRLTLAAFGRTLGGFTTNLPPDLATAGARQIVAGLEATTNATPLAALVEALGTLSARVPPEQVQSLTSNLVATLTATTDPVPIEWVGHALAGFGERLPPAHAAAAARQVLLALGQRLGPSATAGQDTVSDELGLLEAHVGQTLLAELAVDHDPKDPGHQETLGRLLTEFRRTLPADEAEALTRAHITLLAHHLATAMAESLDWPEILQFRGALAKLSKIPSAPPAELLTERFVVAMQQVSDPQRLGDLSRELQPWSKNLPQAQAAAAAGPIVAALTKTTNPSDLARLGRALGVLRERLPGGEVALAARRILEAMAQAKDAKELSDLGSALGDLGSQVNPEQVTAAAGLLLAALETSTYPGDLEALAGALGVFGERLPAPEGEAGARHLLLVMETTTDHRDLLDLANGLDDLAQGLNAGQFWSVLKSAVCVGEVRSWILEGLERRTGQGFDGNVWRAVRWAESQRVRVREAPRWPGSALED